MATPIPVTTCWFIMNCTLTPQLGPAVLERLEPCAERFRDGGEVFA
jgi:hypothetical protein